MNDYTGIKQIIIQPDEESQGRYVAWFSSEILKAVYAVYFHDTVTGAVALHNFTEMIRKRYGDEDIELLVSKDKIPFKSKAVSDLLTSSFKERKRIWK